MTGEPACSTVAAVLRDLGRRPRHFLIARWNWKSALMSAVIRGVLFFAATLRSGFDAATAAFAIEFAFRAVTSGFFSSVTQAFRRATPDWAATLVVVAGLPLVAHVLEYLVHWLGGTERLGRAMVASVAFTVVSAAFTLYVMRARRSHRRGRRPPAVPAGPGGDAPAHRGLHRRARAGPVADRHAPVAVEGGDWPRMTNGPT